MNYVLLDNVGLMEGQMGGVLFFHVYAQKSGQDIYRSYCDMLFDNIYRRIDHGSSHSFFRGLSGIGWGIEYLVKNKLANGDTDELLGDIDSMIIEYRFSV